MVGAQVTVSIALSLLQLRHARQREHGVQAAVRPEQHVGLQPVPDHQALGGVHASELAGDALEHEAAGLPDHGGFTTRGHLQCCGQGPRTCEGPRIKAGLDYRNQNKLFGLDL